MKKLALVATMLMALPLHAAEESKTKIKWEVVKPMEEKTTYLVQLNYLKLKDAKDIPKLVEYTKKVTAILKKSEGAMQFALHAKPESREFWTLSVWKDKKAMKAFGASKEHREAIEAFSDALEDLDFEAKDLQPKDMAGDWSELIE